MKEKEYRLKTLFWEATFYGATPFANFAEAVVGK